MFCSSRHLPLHALLTFNFCTETHTKADLWIGEEIWQSINPPPITIVPFIFVRFRVEYTLQKNLLAVLMRRCNDALQFRKFQVARHVNAKFYVVKCRFFFPLFFLDRAGKC